MTEVFFRFLLLGCISFGGPIAHIGYFQQEFVNKRKWLDDQSFSSALSLCQFLPGPASSQLGMFIGYQRAGFFGALVAYVGFTLPSFLLLTLAAIYSANLQDVILITWLIFAAKLLAVVVVFDAIVTMAKKFVTDRLTALIFICSTLWLIWQSSLFAQLLPIFVAAIIGFVITKKAASNKAAVKKKRPPLLLSLVLFTLFLILFTVPLFFESQLASLFFHFYQAGSFVFGGGHVVLPLLEPLVGDLLSSSVLVEGYAAAQLVPGPMFTIASYLGAWALPLSPVLASLVTTIAIFLPGALLLFAALPLWQSLMTNQKCANSVKLINASVVGLLAAAFYQPVLTSAIHHYADILVALVCVLLLRKYKLSVFWLLVITFSYTFTTSLFNG